mgnify:FL=1
MSEYILSDPVETPPVIPGTEKVKDPFTGEQKKQAGFAVRMETAVKQLEDLENSGFNPVNVYDMLIANLPIVPDAIERYFNTPKFKQYERAKIDFSTAQLRQETGAVINESEIDWIDRTYFPQFGDDPQTLINKRNSRRDALAAMKGQAGEAYDRTKKNVELMSGSPVESEVLVELRKRAKTDEVLRKKLEERGLL